MNLNILDFIRVKDMISIKVGNYIISLRNDEDKIEFDNNVKVVLRENGKLIRAQEGKNICTVSGKEFVLKSLVRESDPDYDNPCNGLYRTDKLRYIGVGSGATSEVAGVSRLVNPVQFTSGEFLAPLAIPPEFPSSFEKTAVRLYRKFDEDEISYLENSSIIVQEFGLFTDGSPDATDPVTGNPSPWRPGSRVTSFEYANDQEPSFYHTMDPFPKSRRITMELFWEIRI